MLIEGMLSIWIVRNNRQNKTNIFLILNISLNFYYYKYCINIVRNELTKYRVWYINQQKNPKQRAQFGFRNIILCFENIVIWSHRFWPKFTFFFISICCSSSNIFYTWELILIVACVLYIILLKAIYYMKANASFI